MILKNENFILQLFDVFVSHFEHENASISLICFRTGSAFFPHCEREGLSHTVLEALSSSASRWWKLTPKGFRMWSTGRSTM